MIISGQIRKLPATILLSYLMLVSPCWLNSSSILAVTRLQTSKQQINPNQALINLLLSTESAEQRNALITANRDQLTPEFVSLLIDQIEIKSKNGQDIEQLGYLKLATTIAEQIKDQLALAGIARLRGSFYFKGNNNAAARQELNNSLTIIQRLDSNSKLMQVLLARVKLELSFIDRREGNKVAAKKNLEEAEANAQKSGNMKLVANIKNSWGNFYNTYGNYREAEGYFQQSIDIYQSLDEQPGKAMPLSNLGQSYYRQNQYEMALNQFNQSLAIAKKHPEETKKLVGDLYTNIGLVNYSTGNYSEALKNYKVSLAIKRGQKDIYGVAVCYNNIGQAYTSQRDYQNAIKSYQQYLSLITEAGQPDLYAFTLAQIGRLNLQMRDYDKAEHYLRESKRVSEKHKLISTLLTTNNMLGNLYSDRGNDVEARENYQEVLCFTEENNRNIALECSKAFNSLANINIEKQEYDEAEQIYLESLRIKVAQDNKPGQAVTLGNLGTVKRYQERYPEALSYYQQSLQLSKELKNPEMIGGILSNIGEIYLYQKDYRKALDYASRAIATFTEIDRREYLPGALNLEGVVYRQLNQFDKAQQSFETAIEISESLTNQFINIADRANYFASQLRPYQSMVELLITQGDLPAAMIYYERARARVLLNILQNGKETISGMTPDEQREEEQFQTRLSELTRKQRQAANQEEKARLTKELKQVENQYNLFTSELYLRHPELKRQRGNLTTIKLQEIVDLLPDTRTAILNYVEQADGYRLFVINKNNSAKLQVENITLPLEIKEYKIAPQNLRLFNAQLESFRSKLRLSSGGYNQYSGLLYETLIKPAAQQLVGKDMLIIVPDGRLWQLSFQALQSAPREKNFLINDFAIAYTPSLTILREMIKPRETPSRKSKLITSFLNPRLVPGKNANNFADLKVTEDLARVTMRLVGKQSKSFTGAFATEKAFKEQAGNSEILVIAAHGIFNQGDPMRSYIQFSQVNNGELEDGRLEAREMFAMSLKNRSTLLLSCEAGNGEIRNGEGIIGLNWAFSVAGSTTNIFSQWKVVDKTTTQLSGAYLQNLQLGNNRTNRISQARALQLAAIKILRLKDPSSQRTDYSHPYYWASLNLIGNPW